MIKKTIFVALVLVGAGALVNKIHSFRTKS
jgi:hypothetical protein